MSSPETPAALTLEEEIAATLLWCRWMRDDTPTHELANLARELTTLARRALLAALHSKATPAPLDRERAPSLLRIADRIERGYGDTSQYDPDAQRLADAVYLRALAGEAAAPRDTPETKTTLNGREE